MFVELTVSETVVYQQRFEVRDDFDIENEDALDELWCAEQDLEDAFVGVNEREITAEVVDD